MVERKVEDGLTHVEELIARRAPYEEVMAALDACVAMLGANEVLPGIAQLRVSATLVYGRSDEERERELIAFLALGQGLLERASTTVSACADNPALAARYLGPVIAELEAAAPKDEELTSTLRSAYAVRSRLGLA